MTNIGGSHRVVSSWLLCYDRRRQLLFQMLILGTYLIELLTHECHLMGFKLALLRRLDVKVTSEVVSTRHDISFWIRGHRNFYHVTLLNGMTKLSRCDDHLLLRLLLLLFNWLVALLLVTIRRGACGEVRDRCPAKTIIGTQVILDLRGSRFRVRWLDTFADGRGRQLLSWHRGSGLVECKTSILAGACSL